jgi:hypothetical protein
LRAICAWIAVLILSDWLWVARIRANAHKK